VLVQASFRLLHRPTGQPEAITRVDVVDTEAIAEAA
jgi:hypothetical protein